MATKPPAGAGARVGAITNYLCTNVKAHELEKKNTFIESLVWITIAANTKRRRRFSSSESACPNMSLLLCQLNPLVPVLVRLLLSFPLTYLQNVYKGVNCFFSGLCCMHN